jgi:phosphoglucosamine mutase
MKLFGTDGIRGRANAYPITPEMALRCGRSIATVLNPSAHIPQRVVIGKDTRVSGTMLESALASGLSAAGVEVILAGVVPTPAIAHLTITQSCAAGVMITASHNPYEDNGWKIFGSDGYKLNDDLEQAVENDLLSSSTTGFDDASHVSVGRIAPLMDSPEQYIHHLTKVAGSLSLKGLKMVIDAGNGAGHHVAPEIFRRLGAEVILAHAEPNGTNINQDCGALYPEIAANLVKQHGADLGLSLDGDADRAIFTDDHGSPVSGDRIMALIARALHQRGELRGNAIAVTVMSNLGLHAAMKAEGIRVITTGVGDRQVIEALREHHHSFGGENSGHLIFADHATTGDGILSALQVLRLLKDSGQSLNELAGSMEEFPQALKSFAVPAKPPLSSLTNFTKLLAEADAALGDSGRQLIRYSGTENKARVMVEHRDADVVAHWTEKLSSALLDAITQHSTMSA